MVKIILVAILMMAGCVGHVPTAGQRFPAPSSEAAWKYLPQKKPPLPAWARVLAESLPQTTARMLELDAVHRTQNPLGPVLYGKLRWAAADANGCAYSKRYAEADLRRAGLPEAELNKLLGGPATWADEDRSVLLFARKMSLAAYTVTDEEMAEILRRFGPEQTVAIVHTLAHANFQDRIFLALGVQVEPGGPFPPVEVRFNTQDTPPVAPPGRKQWNGSRSTSPSSASDNRPDWLGQSFSDVQNALDQQRSKTARIPMPGPERLAKLPAAVRERSRKIVWSTVSLGYQPALTRAWFDCMGTFDREAKLDEVFANTYFWIVTRSNECFY